MKILYGVQGTGNGHISRSRVMAKQLKAHGFDVDFLFSGRSSSAYFDMEVFGDYCTKQGLSLVSSAGRINALATIRSADLKTLVHDVRTLELDSYDMLLTDYEPITAWAARLTNKPCLGIGHQYAFHGSTPMVTGNTLKKTIMQWFAPSRHSLGLHWHPFEANILPPIIDKRSTHSLTRPDANKVLVYLPFEDPEATEQLLRAFPAYHFFVYGPYAIDGRVDNILRRAPSRKGFRLDLEECSAVIGNAGFVLSSECLHLGKRLLIKPVAGQIEQEGNALALAALDLASVCNSLDIEIVDRFLSARVAQTQSYPDVALHIVRWLDVNRDLLTSGEKAEIERSIASLSCQLWQQTEIDMGLSYA